MSMKENNQTGPASFGMTAEEATEILSKVSFSDSKNTEELQPTAWTTDPKEIVEGLKAQLDDATGRDG